MHCVKVRTGVKDDHCYSPFSGKNRNIFFNGKWWLKVQMWPGLTSRQTEMGPHQSAGCSLDNTSYLASFIYTVVLAMGLN